MREIVTIQLGEFANFVGSHFWNFQDELLGLATDLEADPIFRNQNLDMDVLYRSGETQQGVATYTPRLVSVNLKGSLGSMSSRGTLYGEGPSAGSGSSTWYGEVATQRSEPRKRNLFLQSLYEEEEIKGKEKASEIQDKDIVECLDKDVECWTDFSKAHYHPQSLYELSGLWIDSQDFNNYGIGKDIFSEASRGEEICDRFRFFVEECDHIQGIQFLVDDSGGFASVAEDFLEIIADEYTNVPVLLYSIRNPTSSKTTVTSKLHDAISFSRLSSYCKLFTPIGLPSLSTSKASRFLYLGDDKPYQSSAVYAAALHSSTIPFRQSLNSSRDSSEASSPMDVNTFVELLTGRGRQNIVTILDAAIPAPTMAGKLLENTLLMNLQTLTPEIKETVEDNQAIESLCVLGALGSEGKKALVSEVKNAIDAAYEQITTGKPLFCNLTVSRCPVPIPLPFPSIFGNLVGRKGEIWSSPIANCPYRGSLDVQSIPVATRLRSCRAILPFLERRIGNLQKHGIQWGADGAELVRKWGFGREDLLEMRENLSKMVSELNPQFLESSDSD